ncbi:hypothetical protein CC86DRAFT_350319 [Ophiobolus disseminans]|uniref:Calcium-channel protein CCH1 n=1 Tax=Ophiobolus disseminans TaxID=1469910 RepID=A0A6A7A2X0_9PLEO|nr:hypothetical protein CC86DRAFT_350319 [Ophiobolus disseminans]
MSQDDHLNQSIELGSLLPTSRIGAQRLRSSSQLSDRDPLGNALHNGQFEPSRENLLPSRMSSESDPGRHSNHTRSQSGVSADLEASLVQVPLDSFTPKYGVMTRNPPLYQDKGFWTSNINSRSVQSLLRRLSSTIHDTSNRVVNVSTSIMATPSPRTAFTSRSQCVSRRYRCSIVKASERVLSNKWVHTFLMSLILLQLAVLIADTTDQDTGHPDGLSTFGSQWKDTFYLVVFIFYTIEVLLKSATLYSTERKATKTDSRVTLKIFFNVLDLLAVVSFWVNFIMLVVGASASRFRQVLAMMSTLRILRLLLITSSTYSEAAILFGALRESGPKLAKVASFICFVWLLFAVVGVQIFKSSLRRSCIMSRTDPVETAAVRLEGKVQYCGGYVANITGSLTSQPWLKDDGTPGALEHRGYICPLGMVCQEGTNPYNGTVSFDNIFQSLELVFVTFSANTFSTLMYNAMDSEGLPAALYFAAVIIVLYFWLLVLLIGIITGSIQEVRHKSQLASHAQGRTSIKSPSETEVEPFQRTSSSIQKAFAKTKWLWIVIITFGLIAQAGRSSNMSNFRRSFLTRSEMIVTWALLVEIVLRVALDWRWFHQSKQNMTDLGLALVTSLIQIPSLQKSPTYAWLTAFQIARSYRVFWAMAPIRDIMMVSFRYFPALLQLCGFLTLLVFLSSVLATQLFAPIGRGRGMSEDEPFSNLWKSFFGMYQIFTGEDWTQQLYAVTQRDSETRLGWIGAVFIIGWFSLSSIIILNMLLSRIDGSLDIPEDHKRFLQVKNFFSKVASNCTKQDVPGYTQVSGTHVPVDFETVAWAEPHLEPAINMFLDDNKFWKQSLTAAYQSAGSEDGGRLQVWMRDTASKIIVFWQTLLHFKDFRAMSPYLRHAKKFCDSLQKICRILVNEDGKADRYSLNSVFQAFINMAIISQVLIICVTTPLYQREYWLKHEYSIRNWFVIVNLGFAICWTFEAIIKTIVGGLIIGPNAYLKGWTLIDAIVLITSWTSIALSFYNFKQSTAFIMASFSAFRVLRLLTLNKKVMREVTLVFRRGSYKIVASILVSLSLLVPFAIFAVNRFVGQSFTCNDPKITNYNDCMGEFVDSNASKLLSPRVVTRPYYAFDDFGESFYTLFLIVSQEGWTDVMYWARSRSGAIYGTQEPHATSNMNALFFVVFNLLGTIFVTALFAAVMIQNYTESTGVAYLTYNQKLWTEHARLFRHVRPSRHPVNPEGSGPWSQWYYRFATRKEGRWYKAIISIYTMYMIILCIDFYPTIDNWNTTRDIALLALMLLLLLNMVVRMAGLSLRHFIRRPWDILSLVFIIFGLITSSMHIRNPHDKNIGYMNSTVQDIIPIFVIPYVPAFRELFDIAVASIPLISTLLVTWFVLLLFFAIALTQAFGLTRFGTNETANVNFRTVPKALILLFRITMGEGRTKIMEDFATIVGPYCVVGYRYFDSDCGDRVLARLFFISWKVLSTYMFTSVFISLVYESFSNVYQDVVVKSGAITRHDLRLFKNAWKQVDPHGTGYIPSTSLAKFASLVHGVLSIRVYEERFSVTNLQKECRHSLPRLSGEINVEKLNTVLETLSIPSVRDRRRTMNRYHMELILTKDPKLGISMQAALMTLIYYSMIDRRDYLSFEEYIEREKRLQRVEEALLLERIAGLVKVCQCKRSLRAWKKKPGT